MGLCDTLSLEECRLNGYTPNLLCSSCNELGQFKLDLLTDSCNSCCQEDREEDKSLVSIYHQLYRGANSIVFQSGKPGMSRSRDQAQKKKIINQGANGTLLCSGNVMGYPGHPCVTCIHQSRRSLICLGARG